MKKKTSNKDDKEIDLNKDNIENYKLNEHNKIKKIKKKHKCFTKKIILNISIPILILFNIFLINNNPNVLQLTQKIEELEYKIENMKKQIIPKKIGIAFVIQYENVDKISRFISILSNYLIETKKYDIYIMIGERNNIQFRFNKKIKIFNLNVDLNSIKNFDEENNIQLYILNNDVSDYIDIFHSYGKKVIGIYHGAYLSSIFLNIEDNFHIWEKFKKFDSLVEFIPDEYYIYKKLGFNNTIFLPSPYSFDPKYTPNSPLIYKNLLMIGGIDKLKGVKYGIKAMGKILKQVPDAKLTILRLNPPQDILDLIKELKIEESVSFPGLSINITQFYLDSSILLETSISESFPFIINEAKAHGLPIVAFNIDYSPWYQSGVITVNMFDYHSMAREAIELLNNYDYRKKKGEEAKLSFNNFLNNKQIITMWDKFFNSLINNNEDYKKFQKEVECKYYNEILAKRHLYKHFTYAQKFNKYFRCHSFENFSSLKYINNISACPE